MYSEALKDYLREESEAHLHRAYELGRSALRDGKSILEMIEIHGRSLSHELHALSSVVGASRSVEAASVFLREAMSSYEMTNRAFDEANAALRHFNETLEAQVKRIASALHDESGQLLAVVHIKLDEVARNAPSGVREQLQEVRQVMDQIESQLRRLSHELRSPILDDRGLVPALENLASLLHRRTGLKIVVESGEAIRLPKKVETVLYRVIQEALTNASKHARAYGVKIRVWSEPGTACCSVEDDGIGFDIEAVNEGRVPQGLGLAGIRERLQTLGGGCEIQSAPGQGTKMNVRIPVEICNADTSSAG